MEEVKNAEKSNKPKAEKPGPKPAEKPKPETGMSDPEQATLF